MDRRDTLKTLLVGGIAGAAVITSVGCEPDLKASASSEGADEKFYGRNEQELKRDKEIRAQEYLNVHELETIAVLCDIILPKTTTAVSATEAGVPDFVDFIVKDIPSHKLPMRGGLAWLDSESYRRFDKQFQYCSPANQIAIIDDIAYPDPEGKSPELQAGRKFFSLMRNLTVTGYYTSKLGIKDLGYQGNMPNVWDGVPDDVLAKHGMEYDPEWMPKFVDQSKRDVIAEWDDDGNLIT
jgi:hypothetical protein